MQARAIPQDTEHQAVRPEPNRVSDRCGRSLDLGFTGITLVSEEPFRLFNACKTVVTTYKIRRTYVSLALSSRFGV